MRRIFFVIGCMLLAISSISATEQKMGEFEFRVIEDFRTLCNWRQASGIRVPSGRYGFEPAEDWRAARMGFLGTSDFRDIYHWFWREINYDVFDYDYVVLEYKLGEGTKFTMDIWFDNRQLVPRAASYLSGTGEWEELRIPIRGATLTMMGLGIGDYLAYLGEDKVNLVYFKEIRLERKRPLTKKGISLPEVIVIPTPKKMELSGEELPLTSSGKFLFSILLSEIPTVTERIAAQELADEISTLSGIKERVSIFTEGETLPDKKVIFALGVNLSLFDKFQVSPPLQREGYKITRVTHDGKDIIVLAGSDKTGALWSVQTTRQLLQKRNGEIVFPVSEIIDWPTYLYRAMGSCDLQTSFKAVRYKINILFEPWWAAGLFDRWYNPSEAYIKTLQELVDFAVKRGINIAHEISPYHVNLFREDGRSKAIRISRSEDIDKLVNVFRISLERGNRIITLAFDDPARLEGSFHPEDVEFFEGNVLKAHAYLVAELSRRIREEFPDTLITVITRGYEHARDITGYWDDAGVPKDIIVKWTGFGAGVISFCFLREDDIKRFKKGIEERRFVIFDNTPGQRHGMGRGIRMFDPWADRFGNLHKFAYGIHGMQGFSEPPYPKIADIQALTMADYMWNPGNFDAKTTLIKAMTRVAGKEAVDHLFKFRHHYLRIAHRFPVEVKPAKLSIEKKKSFKVTEEKYRRLQPDIKGVRKALEKIKRTSKNVQLAENLESKYKLMIEVIHSLRVK